VLRHADAGYDLAKEQAERTGLAATVPTGLT
jgi:urocanate hydratase